MEETRRGHGFCIDYSQIVRIRKYSTSPRRFFIKSGYTSTSRNRRSAALARYFTVESGTRCQAAWITRSWKPLLCD